MNDYKRRWEKIMNLAIVINHTGIFLQEQRRPRHRTTVLPRTRLGIARSSSSCTEFHFIKLDIKIKQVAFKD
jgi:hypothetical protein